MAIEVKELKPPQKINPAAATLISEAQQAGFTQLGWLSVKVFTSMVVTGFADKTGTVVLAIVGTNSAGAYHAAAVDLVTTLASGETVTTTSNRTICPQPQRGIFKYSGTAKASVRKLVEEHAKNLKKHKSKAAASARSLKELAELIEHYLKHEMEGLLVRHWLSPKPPTSNATAAKAKGIEGGYISTVSNTIRIGMENGKYMRGACDIHDSGTYKVISQNEYACVVAFSSRLGGVEKLEITREGKKYLFTPLPTRTDPEVFLRLDGAEFLADSKGRLKIEKPELGKGAASGEFLPVVKTVEECEKGFLQNVRKEVIPLLVREGILTGKTVNKKVHVLDDTAFRHAMRFGIENFALNQQGWSFVAFKAPFDNVAKALRARSDISNYRENVGATKLGKEASTPTSQGKRHVFLVRFPPSEWSILIQTIHWVESADFEFGDALAKDISRRLKCTTIAAADSDAGGSGAGVYKSGKKTGTFSTEENWAQFSALFYREAIFLPESFIAEAGKQPCLMVNDPAAVDRVDYMQITLPDTGE